MREGLNTLTGSAVPKPRVKITEEMVDAGVTAFRKYAEDEAMKASDPMPDFDGMPDEAKALHRAAIRVVLRAGADAI